MKINKQTILSYHNFNALSNDVIELAKEIMPDKVIYINFLNEAVQVTMRVSKHNTNVNVKEGITIPIEDAICNQINYPSGKPLILENIRENSFNEKVNKTIEDCNIGSYLGIPISFKNGVRFGTLCAAHHDRSHFEDKDVALLTNIAKLFSYYLDLEHIAYKDAHTLKLFSSFIRIQTAPKSTIN
ncbi:GAF domain-containing protein [Acholeplasma vituli]|uniref:GAF domain-containing protein n=1 Tax=Paracholeplasma vituli TaxID=69473 RepID=A0ABT2PYA9_9MOLU|nr:GAF domain-containing protein [Paracholeplasma vituli]MCU0105349.1 GAF domain-containing protein [Paracholeplasma vituli]